MVCVAGETAGLGCLAEISRRGENEGARGSVPDFPGVFACVFSLFLLNTGSFFRLRNAVWVCANDFIIGVAFVSSAGAVVAGTAAEASVERISLRIALNPASMFNLFSSAGDEPVSGRIDVSSNFSGLVRRGRSATMFLPAGLKKTESSHPAGERGTIRLR